MRRSLSRGAVFIVLWYYGGSGSVAQWIEQLRPKEKVVRSTRARATKYVFYRLLAIFLTINDALIQKAPACAGAVFSAELDRYFYRRVTVAVFFESLVSFLPIFYHGSEVDFCVPAV